MKINRKEIIERHNPLYKNINKNAPLSVGNGSFCFTADFTGLQTFSDEYSQADDAFPLCTMAEWGWHSYPQPENDETNLRLTVFDTYGRNVYYACDNTGQEELFKRIRVNAHKFHLGKIGFELPDKELSINDCKPVSQILSMWEGILYSEFKIDENTVKTETFISSDDDVINIRISSPLLKESKLRITIVFPYGSHKKAAADFFALDQHTSRLCICEKEAPPCCHIKAKQVEAAAKNSCICVEREMDNTLYKVTVSGNGFKTNIEEKQHTIQLIPISECIKFSVKFEPVIIPSIPNAASVYKGSRKQNPESFDNARIKCKTYWENYWSCGGFIDFSGSADKRAFELERRIILSQYLIAIQSRGYLPPAETGLTCNSWYGKFHLEMHFWHHAHFVLWGRTEEVIKALEYYKKILPVAKEIASSQGYSGARWPKMCDPSGKNTPSSVAVFLIWQQVHPIMFAHLIRRAYNIESGTQNKNSNTQNKVSNTSKKVTNTYIDASSTEINNILQEYKEIIIETAEFMKSFIHWDGNRYVVGPPYIPAQERHDPKIVLNAAYELEYFRLGFQIADNWLEALGEKKRYGEIAEKLSLPAIKDGVYLAHENCPDTFNVLPFYTDHPSMLAMYGVLASDKTDENIMSATLDKVMEVWDKKTFYGWDFPVMAMTACRLGRYNDAVNLLLMDSPKNTFMENGHNRMTGDDALPCYLPGNGGLLLATAMMAAGYDSKSGPLFPEDFNVKTEGILPYI